MPVISTFFGIIVRMFYDGHNPPHLHVVYGQKKAVIDFLGNVVKGSLGSRTALRLVRDWIDIHADELKENWELARAGKGVKKIPPLE